MPEQKMAEVTLENLEKVLENDTKVKFGGFDVDGILRGKMISKKKFLNIAEEGVGFCSLVFGWDMHDQTYFRELAVSNAENGYHDIIGIPDLSSMRRIPWEDNVPFFLVSWFDPDSGKPISVCPRGILKTAVAKLHAKGYSAMAGGMLSIGNSRFSRADMSKAEYEFFQYKAPTTDSKGPLSERNVSSTAKFLRENAVESLPPLTEGMFGYSLERPGHNKEYFYGIFDACEKFDCGIEGWHTESGPGVYEAALSYGEIQKMADKAGLFK
jgi:glutamine synthetase